MPPGVCAFVWICSDMFSNTPLWQQHWAPQRLFDLCVRTNMGQNETSNTVASSRLFFFFILFALSSFQSSAQRDRVSLLRHSQVVYVCAASRDETWQSPSSSPQTQRSTTLRHSLCVARFSSFLHPFLPSFSSFFSSFSSSTSCSHRWKKGKWENERDKILIRRGTLDKSRGIMKGSNDNTCKTQILNLRERLGGGSLIFPLTVKQSRGAVCLGTGGVGMWLWAQSWQTDWHMRVCVDLSPRGPQLFLFTETNLKSHNCVKTSSLLHFYLHCSHFWWWAQWSTNLQRYNILSFFTLRHVTTTNIKQGKIGMEGKQKQILTFAMKYEKKRCFFAFVFSPNEIQCN